MRRWWMLVLGLMAALAVTACENDDDGPGSTVEELCCACVDENGCGNDDFSFGACVPDGYAGQLADDDPFGVDLICVDTHCATLCADHAFPAESSE